jgi:hypothetical protein
MESATYWNGVMYPWVTVSTGRTDETQERNIDPRTASGWQSFINQHAAAQRVGNVTKVWTLGTAVCLKE